MTDEEDAEYETPRTSDEKHKKEILSNARKLSDTYLWEVLKVFDGCDD